MSPVPTSTMYPGGQPTNASTEQINAVPPPPNDSTPPSGGVQALPNEALDFAAKMFDLARQGSLDLIPYIQAGLPPNLTNNRGDTLLMLAAYHGHAELVQSLLTIPRSSTRIPHPPADPNQLNGRGQSILAGAVFKGHDHVVNVLVEHGADPLAGQPNAEDSARMFNKWDDTESQKGYKDLFESASGRGQGAREAPEAVPDREEQQRLPGQAQSQGAASTIV